MGDPHFDIEDFQVSVYVDGDVGKVGHLEVAEDLQGNGYGSVILETIKRVIYQTHDIDVLEVSMGGGEGAEEFLKKNGFEICERRYYSEANGEFGVDARYDYKWVSYDYGE